MTTLRTNDRDELLKKNPRVNAAQFAQVQALLAELEQAGLYPSGPCYLVEPALGAPKKMAQSPMPLLTQSPRLGE